MKRNNFKAIVMDFLGLETKEEKAEKRAKDRQKANRVNSMICGTICRINQLKATISKEAIL